LPEEGHASAANERLKFNQSFEISWRRDMARLRFLAKFAMDVFRTALASAVGAFLFSHMWTQGSAPPIQRVASATAASEEAAQVIRDEHNVMAQYLKAKHEEERAEIEKEVRETQAARMVHEKVAPVRQADLEPAKTVPARPRAVPTGGVSSAANSASASAVTNAALTVASLNSSAAGMASTTVITASLPPPTAVQAPPDAATPYQIDAQHDPSRESHPPNLAEQAAAVTHVNDVVSFVHDVASWFRHDDAPVPPAEVHTNPFADGPM
jgi:hypothetical protein